MISDFTGKTAVITGAGSGIGRGLAVRCAAEGMNVVASDVEQGALDETVAQAGGATIGVVADVADAASVDALADAAFGTFGEVHLLCNNAGVFQAGILWERTLEEQIRATAPVSVNRGPFRVPVSLSLENPLPRAIQAEVVWEDTSGWQIDPARVPVDLARGAKMRVMITANARWPECYPLPTAVLRIRKGAEGFRKVQ